MNILVLAPHPDDAAIGCGGTLVKLAKKNKIVAVYMTSGESGSLCVSPKKLISLREAETKKAAKVLGIQKTVFLREPDGFLKFNRQNLQKLISIVRAEKPHTLFIPYVHDKHRDHRITHDLATDAVWKAAGPWHKKAGGQPHRVQTVLCYETWTPILEPAHFEGITQTIAKKLRAINCFKSQVKDISYADAIKGLNRYRGVMSGTSDFAECFDVLQE